MHGIGTTFWVCRPYAVSASVKEFPTSLTVIRCAHARRRGPHYLILTAGLRKSPSPPEPFEGAGIRLRSNHGDSEPPEPNHDEFFLMRPEGQAKLNRVRIQPCRGLGRDGGDRPLHPSWSLSERHLRLGRGWLISGAFRRPADSASDVRLT